MLKIHRKFATHQFFGDHELTIFVQDSDIYNHNIEKLLIFKKI
jgi:hypothetical protein